MWTGHDPGARWKWLKEIEMDDWRGVGHSCLDVSSAITHKVFRSQSHEHIAVLCAICYKRGIALERLAGAGFFTNWFNCGEESTTPVLE